MDDTIVSYGVTASVFVLYMGLISGWIPSPLYRQNERWPRGYVYFQVLLLALTLSRLDWKKEEVEEVELDVEDFTGSCNIFAKSLYQYVFEKGGGMVMLEDLGWAVAYMAIAMAAGRIFFNDHKEVATKKPKKLTPMWMIMLRNLVLFCALTTFFQWQEMADGYRESYCPQHNPNKALFSDRPVAETMDTFLSAWRRFHPNHLKMVRVSHAFLYPSILLVLSRRRMSDFIIWAVFVELDMFHLVADMVHYISGPELAWSRLSFQESPDDCFLDTAFLNDILAYPTNFLYLATGMGDTTES